MLYDVTLHLGVRGFGERFEASSPEEAVQKVKDDLSSYDVEIHKANVSVREAAERLTPERAACCHGAVELDTKILAAAYLAEHPADEDELVTRAWLGEVGLGVEYSHEIGLGFALHTHDLVPWGIVYEDAEMDLPPVKTRGDVRRLCKALGKELKETGE